MAEADVPESAERGTLKWAEQIDPVFAFWKAHHDDACKAYVEKDFDLAERLCRETLEETSTVPILYRAEAHAMLATYTTIDDYVDQARKAKEQYRHLYEKHPGPTSKILWINVHDVVRRAEARAGYKELSAPYIEPNESEETSHEATSKVDQTQSKEVLKGKGRRLSELNPDAVDSRHVSNATAPVIASGDTGLEALPERSSQMPSRAGRISPDATVSQPVARLQDLYAGPRGDNRLFSLNKASPYAAAPEPGKREGISSEITVQGSDSQTSGLISESEEAEVEPTDGWETKQKLESNQDGDRIEYLQEGGRW